MKVLLVLALAGTAHDVLYDRISRWAALAEAYDSTYVSIGEEDWEVHVYAVTVGWEHYL